jgi:hypothetical protein
MFRRAERTRVHRSRPRRQHTKAVGEQIVLDLVRERGLDANSDRVSAASMRWSRHAARRSKRRPKRVVRSANPWIAVDLSRYERHELTRRPVP